jgi:hypothetical protein
MKRIAWVLAVTVAASGAAFAGPKDKIGEALVNPSSLNGDANPGNRWDNRTVAGKVKSNKCKYQVSAKANPTTDLVSGPVICFAEADVYASSLPPGLYGNSVVMAGTASGGKLSIKGDLRAIGCGIQSASTALNGTTICFLEDLTNFDWQAECAGAGMLPIAKNVLPGTESINAGGIVGLCQGVGAGLGERIPRPAVPVLAEQGSHQPLL